MNRLASATKKPDGRQAGKAPEKPNGYFVKQAGISIPARGGANEEKKIRERLGIEVRKVELKSEEPLSTFMNMC